MFDIVNVVVVSTFTCMIIAEHTPTRQIFDPLSICSPPVKSHALIGPAWFATIIFQLMTIRGNVAVNMRPRIHV